MGYDPLPLNFSIEYLLRCMIVFKGKKKKKNETCFIQDKNGREFTYYWHTLSTCCSPPL